MVRILSAMIIALSLAFIAPPISGGIKRINSEKQKNAKEVAVRFEEVKDLTALGRSYSFLNKQLKDLKAETESPPPMQTRISIGKVNLSGSKLLFIRLEGALYRGTEGSPVDVYVDQGKGFKPALSVTCGENIAVLEQKPLTLVLETSKGNRKWALNEASKKFELAKN